MITREKKKLIKYFSRFQLLDLLGFANILNIKDSEFKHSEDFIEAVIDGILEQPKKEKIGLIKLAKDISLANKEFLENSSTESGYCGRTDLSDSDSNVKDNCFCGDSNKIEHSTTIEDCSTSCGRRQSDYYATQCGGDE